MALPRPRDLEPYKGDPSLVDEAAALSSPQALARFEFESGKGNEGTKVLMVEINDTSAYAGDWEIEWSAKTTVLSAKDRPDGSSHRVYFLLAPGASIPPIIKLSQGGTTFQTNPLPAIFPPELGVSATTAGKKGVLHTVWGKQRLSVLQKEIESEMKKNGEGIGLEMALQEKKWIEEHFGVSAKIFPEQHHMSPNSPKTPGSGGKLSEKLKGLKLGTSASELRAATNAGVDSSSVSVNPLSPNLGDVAVSSFAAFHNRHPKPAPSSSSLHQTSPLIDSRVNSRMPSMDAIAGGSTSNIEDPETEDDLFAVRMSPRSPEMTKSPFSLTAREAAS